MQKQMVKTAVEDDNNSSTFRAVTEKATLEARSRTLEFLDRVYRT